eukprot:scaffold34643_cov139-Amphora_coffeaeformis.AAC.1
MAYSLKTAVLLAAMLVVGTAQARLLGKNKNKSTRQQAYGANGWPLRGSPKAVKNDNDCIFCDRPSPYSVVTPNDDVAWQNQTYHAQVWYLGLEDAYNMWKAGYFDYVLDVRGLDYFPHQPVDLPGWQESHIPNSYPTDFRCLVDGLEADCENGPLTLDYFRSSAKCLDAKILVHCWSGVNANKAVTPLVELGFTNLYTIGPEKSGGFIKWAAEGYDAVGPEEYEPGKLIPSCAKQCD